jgi:heme exporter protein B
MDSISQRKPLVFMFTACSAMLRRDLLLAWRRRSDLAMPLLYALIVTTLFPFALGPDPGVLAHIAGGLVILTVVLAMLMTLDSMFRDDVADGSLEQLMLAPLPLAAGLAMKMLAYWLATALPLLGITPLMASMLHLPLAAFPALLAALLLVTPLLSLGGGVLTALLAGMRHSRMLLALMLLPLCTPMLIFAAGAVSAAQQGLPWAAPLAWLGAMLVMTLPLAPWACALALRIALEA